ncbi:Hypothetical_protein [Hexamita inflata]|uniref:Hypothetical_protein n=1 Tax=Hexamita inflata TaxID=28002 RepID=A0AA86TYG1_9EUKA|nr:Hypothetical protein HINF_LOCUS19457 [Hexamita inflata]
MSSLFLPDVQQQSFLFSSNSQISPAWLAHLNLPTTPHVLPSSPALSVTPWTRKSAATTLSQPRQSLMLGWKFVLYNSVAFLFSIEVLEALELGKATTYLK